LKSKFTHICISILAGLSRFVLAFTFIFSGFVKAADPLGMTYKLNAYLAHWDMALPDGSLWLDGMVMALSTVEFLLGIYLLLGMRRRLTHICIFTFMLGMTALTAYIYAYDPVPDCGCFGEALVISNKATFFKNLLLLGMAVLLLARRTAPPRLISERNQWVTSIYSFCYIVILNFLSIRYLPALEFTAYKVGTDIPQEMTGKMETYFIYEKDGERKEFDSAHLPAAPWKYVDTRTEIESEPTLADFALFSTDGEDRTYELLTAESYVFLLTLPNVSSADDGNTDRINDIYDYCKDHGLDFFCVTASGKNAVEAWKDRTGAAYPFLYSSEETLKAMVRSNPGLMLLHRGRIAGKWSQNALPEVQEENLSPQMLESKMAATALPSWARLLLWFAIPLFVIILSDRLWVGSKFYKHYIYKKHLNQKRMRRKIVAGNWKMNKTLQDGVALAKELNEILTADKPNCDVVICTPFIHLASVAAELDSHLIGLGAENCADKASGAYTGEVSAEMVKSTGAQYVILGHSERRAYYHETPEILKEKINLALANGLKVIFCIGEVLEERESNRQNEVVKAQLEGSLFDLSKEEFAHIILAYEPVWAIGTGKTATAEQAEEMHAFIRSVIAEKFGAEAAENVSILYGGSCKPGNAKEIFAKANVDGGLIGGAALKAADFKGIIDAWK